MPKPEPTSAQREAVEEALKRIGDSIRRRSTVLDLSHLQLTALPPRILQLAKLTEIDLSHNQFEELPPELAQFPSLARLDLSNNPLAILPPEVSQLENLTRLDLTHTPLKSLPPEVCRLVKLTRLYLDHNRLEDLPPGIGQLANLTRLHLSHNLLGILPAELARLTSLTRLDVSHNRLETLPEDIRLLARLTVLDVSHNPLVTLDAEVGQLSKLTVLRLENTRLGSLPPELGQLSNLTELDLRNNQLATLPESLRDLEKLDRLFLHENPGLQLNRAILGPDPGQSPDAKTTAAKSILDFHFGRQSGTTRPLNEVKLILLGSSGSGKTSIAQALRDLPFRDRESSTAGIACSDWVIDGTGQPPVTAHIWDCSGQVPAHALHPFFFSPRSLYVVVLTGREHGEKEDAEYWLQMIRESAADSCGQGPPVVVALNQWNVPGCRPEVDRQALRDRYPFIRGFVEMDCKVKKGVPALKAALQRELERMPWVREPFPGEWDAVRHALETGKPHITIGEYRELCLEHGIKDEGQQDYLADFLHHLGTTLTVPDEPAALLNAGWLARHLYPLLHRAGKQAGILQKSDVELVLTTENDDDSRSCLMRVLEHSGLACAGQAASGGVWLLPHSQPETAPGGLDSFRDDPDAIRLRFIYQEMPEDPVLKVTARRFDFIEEIKERKQQWRHGVILSRKGARALFRTDPQQRQVTITVTGPGRSRHQLADLCLAEMRELHAEFPGVEESGDEATLRMQRPAPDAVDGHPANHG